MVDLGTAQAGDVTTSDFRRRQKQHSDKLAETVRCPDCGAPPGMDCGQTGQYYLARRVAADDATPSAKYGLGGSDRDKVLGLGRLAATPVGVGTPGA